MGLLLRGLKRDDVQPGMVSNSNSKWGHCVVYCRKFSLPQWDIMSSGGSVQSVANLAKGKDRGNVVNIQVSFIFISKC